MNERASVWLDASLRHRLWFAEVDEHDTASLPFALCRRGDRVVARHLSCGWIGEREVRAFDLDVLVREIAAARACHVSWSLLFLRSPTREIWLEWLGREFPHRLAAYERAYARRSHLGGAYVARIRELMRRLCERHGVAVRLFPREKASPADDQLGLFG